MKTVIRIGSRESRLAVTQTEIIKGQIEAHFPHIRVEIVTMKTTGDRILDRSLEQIGGKGLFVKELDQALRKGRVDLSVHSLKDMPMDIPEDLPILAYSKREDPRDVLIFRQGQTESISGGMIGTSSKRRRLQLERLYPDCHFQGIRGNVQTRLRKLEEEGFCATVLAAAGFDMEIVERHHNLKVDAPSGTALALADSLNEAMDHQYHYVYDRSRTGNSGSAGKSRGISGTFRSAQRSPV